MDLKTLSYAAKVIDTNLISLGEVDIAKHIHDLFVTMMKDTALRLIADLERAHVNTII